MAPPSPAFPRFYKLHERKCEPIVMTVPRKVRPPGPPPTHSLLQQTGQAGERSVNGTRLSVDVVSGLVIPSWVLGFARQDRQGWDRLS